MPSSVDNFKVFLFALGGVLHMSQKKITTLSSEKKLREFREEHREMLEPRHHEFYRDRVEYGFIKMTFPKKRG